MRLEPGFGESRSDSISYVAGTPHQRILDEL